MLRFTSSITLLFALCAPLVACSSSDDSTGGNADADHIADADHFDSAPQDFGPPPDTAPGDSPVVDTGASDAPTDTTASDTPADGDAADPCTASGGTVSTALCCASASDFPNNCATGACGCAPSSSHEVKVCNCPSPQCWNGTACVLPPG
jgi:hypothetical protein